MEDGGFGAFMDANPSPPTTSIYPLGGNCSQLCGTAANASASAAPATDGGDGAYNRFTASLAGAPAASQNEHGSHRVLTAGEPRAARGTRVHGCIPDRFSAVEHAPRKPFALTICPLPSRPALPAPAAQLPALGDVKQGASFSYTTVKNCSFPAPHYMPHANKLTMPVAGAG